ncbi:MAG TPA: hypothetical protein PKA63_10180 [Oligoflexia bacterium]|nr:hypothetical protein [Oligoflexia bacterium]HMP49024.1 hypothetical protein [Oligoflexia bacterium]
MKYHLTKPDLRRRAYLFLSALASVLILLLTAIPFQRLDSEKSVSGLSLPAFGAWNGFLGHVVVLECMNQNAITVNIKLQVRDQINEIIGEEEFAVPGFGKTHIILNKFGINEKYGTFEIGKVSGDQDNDASLSCNTLTYRFNSSNKVEYATSSSLNSTVRGKSYGVYNSINPSITVNSPVYNWLTIFNPGELSFSGNVYLRDQGGNEIGIIPVQDIPPGGRQDFGLGHVLGQVVGVYEIVPDNPFLFYGAFLSRYSEVGALKYNFSMHIPSSKGKRDSGMVAASSMGHAINWAEIANVSPEAVEAQLEVFNRFGERIYDKRLKLLPYGQYHENLNNHIGEENVGYFRVRSNKNVIVQSFFYGVNIDKPDEIAWACNSKGGEGFYNATGLGLNTYLNAPNWLRVYGEDDTVVTIKMRVYDMSGKAVILPDGGIVNVSGSVNIPLHEYTGYNFIGSVYLESLGKSLFQAEIVRVYLSQKEDAQTVPLIESMLSIVPPDFNIERKIGVGETDDPNSGKGGQDSGHGENEHPEYLTDRDNSIKYCTKEYQYSKALCEIMFDAYCGTRFGDLDFSCRDKASDNDAGKDKYFKFKLSTGATPAVRIYSYNPKLDTRHHVILEYADLLNLAIEEKQANPSDIVEVKFAIYKIDPKIFVEVKTGNKASNEGFRGSDIAEMRSENLISLILRAIRAGVNVKLLYHNPDDDAGIADFFSSHLGSNVRRVGWGAVSSNQMHNKFVIMRKIHSNGKETGHVVYTTTANGDEFAINSYRPVWNVAQTGVLVRDHAELYNAYAEYFDLIWDNYNDIRNFRTVVRRQHGLGILNYADEHFSAYFYPLPENNFDPEDDYTAGWVSRFNPITELVNKLYAVKGKRAVRINAYWVGTTTGEEAFADRFGSSLSYLYTNPEGNSPLFVMSAIHNRSKGIEFAPPIKPFDGQVLHSRARTHEKNMTFAFSDTQEFYSISGSVNLHRAEFRYKANNQLVIRELLKEHQIYDAFNDILNNVMN